MVAAKQERARARFAKHAKTGVGKVGKAARSTTNPAKKRTPSKKDAAVKKAANRSG